MEIFGFGGKGWAGGIQYVGGHKLDTGGCGGAVTDGLCGTFHLNLSPKVISSDIGNGEVAGNSV